MTVQFQLDLNGLLSVTATEKATGLIKSVTIDTHGQHRLNLDAAKANLEALFAENDMSSPAAPGGDGDDDDTGDDGDADGSPAPAAGGKAPAGLPASARDLRRRADALVVRGVSDTEAAEIRAKIEASTAAIDIRDWAALQQINDSLSDILFYLED